MDSSWSQTSFLVVDDDEFACEVLTGVLRHLGASRVTSASDGDSALRLASQLRPDFVLLDIYMPQDDGWILLGQLRRALPNAAIIMVTGSGMQADFLKSMDEHADGFCIKPVSSEIMNKALLSAQRRRQQGSSRVAH